MPAKTFLFYHVILTTKYRRPTLNHPNVLARVQGALDQQAQRRGGMLLAFNHGPDHAHIHALVILPPQHAVAPFLRDAKSQAARLINAYQGTTGRPLWGRRYFAASVGGGGLDAARRYVMDQWAPC